MTGHARTELRYGRVDPEYATRLATTPPEDDGPVWMVNLMQYREIADTYTMIVRPMIARLADSIS